MRTDAAGRQHERGASLIAAIFLLVVLASLGAFAVRLGLMQQQTTSTGLLATQALHAAKSGVAWAAQRALASGWCATASLGLAEAGTAGFTLDVSCTQTSHVEGGATLEVYRIDVLAEFGTYGQADYVSRRIEAKIVDRS